ncbi:hypothetical protein I4J42_09880 [Corynebacterium belfantii]|uniref:hypothetical protein n=1 Tax=Corynebacterium belfantii TaxID=2014537 RepID=UPI0018D493E3|nr:hypothetical protein [Corynebacterium belfantii]MBG9334109.1 hypothetical protein [Corynebacterium belfantii]
MLVFATRSDLELRWADAVDSGADLEALLADASLWVATLYQVPDQPSDRLAGVLRLIVCAMVKRALLSEGTDHLDSVSETAGPFSQSLSFRNSEGNFFLTAAEKALLESALADVDFGGVWSVEAVGW